MTVTAVPLTGSNRTSILVSAAQQGIRRAQEDLFEHCLPRVRHIVSLRMGKKLRQMMVPQDIIQEVMFMTLNGPKRFKPGSKGSFRNWLARRVEREIVDLTRRSVSRLRHQGRTLSILRTSIFRDREPRSGAQAEELENKIEEALLQLPKHYREVIILRRLCEMSYREIAETMGFAEEHYARQGFKRALKKLKEILQCLP